MKIRIKIIDQEGHEIREYRVDEKYRTVIQDMIFDLTILDKRIGVS